MRWWLIFLVACSAPATKSGDPDAARPPDAFVPPPIDAPTACAPSGAPGTCISVDDCAAIADHTSIAGYCPGPSTIQCCIVTPDPANNPPTPAGYRLMKQSEVTADMTTWAVDILHDPTTYAMFSTTTRMFGAQLVLARVEWHPPDFQNGAIHRGVTLYVPI